MAAGGQDGDDARLNLKYEYEAGVDPVFGMEQRPPRLNLKESLALSDLMATGGVFEVDPGNDAAMALDLDAAVAEHDGQDSTYDMDFVNDTEKLESELLNCITIEEIQGFFEDTVAQMEDYTPDGKVKKLIIREGEGEAVEYKSRVFYNYEMYAEGEDGPFDSSVQRDKVESLDMEKAECIEGLAIALLSMKVKELAKFWIDYDYAFGRFGAPPRIPPTCPILCVVELLDCVSGEKLNSVHYMSTEERHFLPFEKIMEAVQELRNTGNVAYKAGDYSKAIKCYQKGIDYLVSYMTVKPEEDEERTKFLYKLYSNAAQALLKDNKPKRACTICFTALKLPRNEMTYKIFYRFAQAKYQLNHDEETVGLCKKSLGCAPVKARKEIQDLIDMAQLRLRDDEKDLSEMYKKMVMGPDGPEASKE